MKKEQKKSKESIERPKPSMDTKLFSNLQSIVKQFMGGKNYRPMSQEQLMQRLGLPAQHGTILHQILRELVEEGSVELYHDAYLWKPVRDSIVTGELKVHPRGFGFLRPDDIGKYPEDVFIPKHLTLNAVDGDRVEVLINSEVYSEKGPEGKVLSILSRGRTHVAGIILHANPAGDITAHVPLLGTSQEVIVEPHPEHVFRQGDRIVMEVLDWGAKGEATFCRMSYYMGHISDPSCDVKAAIEEYGIKADFPHGAIVEAKAYGKVVSRKELAKREDLRHLECVTIDPDTARDFDDAVNVRKDERGHYHLGVHVADVSHYVKAGSALDQEAKLRCNSTYFPGHCVPMLPEELSNNLCSLKEKVNRLTISVLMEFDQEGTLVDYRIVRGVIKSNKRFTYREAKKVLDGKLKSKHADALHLMVEVCGLLKKKRYARGSLEFAMQDLVVIVDEHGVPQKIDHVHYDITHQLIEEFMLKANEVVATHLSGQGKHLSYRVHDEPAEENMRDFAMLARAFGFELSQDPTPVELQNLFEEALKTPYGNYLATCYIRRMRLAMYSADNIGHYGLGLTHYCHFTSPIRRYVDLVVHRIVCGESAEKQHLDAVSLECSEQERISAKAEQSVVLLKKLRLIHTYHQKEPGKLYEAVVTRVKPFGIFFEVLDYMMESYLHVSLLESDYFVFDDKQNKLNGTRTGLSYVSGDKLTVRLKEVDFILKDCQWHLVERGNKESKAAKPAKKNFRHKINEKSRHQKPRKRR